MSATDRSVETGPSGSTGTVEPADRVAELVLAVPGVHDLHAGVIGEIATYLPGRRVNGVRLRETGCEVHLVLEHGASIATTTDAVRAAVRKVVDGPVDITVQDVAEPGASADPAGPAAGAV